MINKYQRCFGCSDSFKPRLNPGDIGFRPFRCIQNVILNNTSDGVLIRIQLKPTIIVVVIKICYTSALMTELPRTSSFVKKISKLIPESIALFCALILIRGYEIVMAFTNHVLPGGATIWFAKGLFVDITFSACVVFIFLLVSALLSYINKKIARYLFLFLGILLLMSYVSVSEYFAYTLLPAGRDIFGYTSTELSNTIATAISPSFGVIFPFVLFLGFFGWGTWQFNRWEVGRDYPMKTIGTLLVLSIMFWIVNPSEANYQKEVKYYITANKAEILFSSVASELSETSQTQQKWQGKEYPLLKTSQYEDVLGPYFKKADQKPNIVFIIVEGLGRAFSGAGAQYGGFTPFLDSLSQKGLWFKNMVSGSGRSFGLHPTILGSLPFARKGFMELGADMPAHRTLISLLNKNGYQSHYFCGYNSHFDNIDVFLERQHIDYIMDESKFDSTYKKMDAIEGGFTWGYGDKALFPESLKKLDQRGNKQPRLDMYFTLNTHEPFIIPNEKRYLQRVDKRLAQMEVDEQKKDVYTNYKHIFASLLYTDDAIRNFINRYKKRPEYDHTIFVITGDHRMGPIPHASKIDRFRVFFTIYSPLIKSPQQFASVSTHFNVTPTLLGYLKKNYNIVLPDRDHWMAGPMDTSRTFRNEQRVPLMRNKNQLVDYLDHDYFLADGQLFKLEPDLWIAPVNNQSKKADLQQELRQFKAMNHYVTTQNKIIPTDQNTKEYVTRKKLVTSMKLDTLNDSQLFWKARSLAIEGKRDTARAIARYVLANNPNYHDMRTLLGRSYAWDGQYDKAREVFRDVIKRDPGYMDAYNALMDVEIWSKHFEVAVAVADKGLAVQPDQKSLLEKKAKALQRMGKSDEAKAVRNQVKNSKTSD